MERELFNIQCGRYCFRGRGLSYIKLGPNPDQHSVLQSRIVHSKPVAMHSLQVFFCVVCVAVGFQAAQAALGGATCTIPAVGSGPGASTVCTASANGFCLLDHITVTGSPVTAVTYDGVCVCYTGYSGPSCATVDSTTSTTTTSNNNAITALVLGGLGAYLLSQGSSGFGTETDAQAAQEALYLQQAGFGVGK